MKGIVIWAQSNCRSTMALYRELIRELNVHALITLWHYNKCEGDRDIREQVGFSHDEFSDLPIEPVGEDFSKGLSVLKSHSTWHHVFCVWQGSPVYRRLIVEAKRLGCPVAVMCESPCNMASGWRRLVKAIYMRLALPLLARPVVKCADLFINDSGDNIDSALRLGWRKERIIPFGYFSPPILNSTCRQRTSNHPFEILATGIMAKYRGADVLVEALHILKMRGVDFHATITQKGELWSTLKAKAKAFNLPIDFPGFVEMPELIKMYETCSVYVGAGRYEPWGMRLNDALHCGAPLVVSRGMGGVQLVDAFNCGLAVAPGDACALADAIERLATEDTLYAEVASNAVHAAEMCLPVRKARELVRSIQEYVPGWLNKMEVDDAHEESEF